MPEAGGAELPMQTFYIYIDNLSTRELSAYIYEYDVAGKRYFHGQKRETEHN
jgi:hypothetical protein